MSFIFGISLVLVTWRMVICSRGNQFLINTTGCSIEYTDPFSKDILRYLKKPKKIVCPGKIMTFISKKGDEVYLNINQTVALNESLLCAYQDIERDADAKNPDNNIAIYSDWVKFTSQILLPNETVIRVWCENKYENFHYIFRNEFQSKFYDKSRPNVLLLGIDSISRSNFIRTMPKTTAFVRKHDWVDLKGYNKIGHNTFPNLMAVMAGLTDANFNRRSWFDSIDFIWKDYKSENYTTALSEDFPKYSTFNFNKKGFYRQPTDFYLRPYYEGLLKLPRKQYCGVSQCFGPENIGPRMVKLLKDYIETVKNRSNSFGIFWMNSFSHSDMNCARNMDQQMADLLQHLKNEGVFCDTFVIFFSDHGSRWGGFVETRTGWLENRLPFMYILVPDSFRLEHKQKYLNLIQNSQKLTSPFDLYMTLQNILKLYNRSYVVKPVKKCATCHSLFKPISSKRTCSDAGIPEFYCACSKYVMADKNGSLSINASNFALNYINQLLNATECSTYSLNHILEAKFYKTSGITVKNIMLRISLEPAAKFELNINVKFKNKTATFEIQDIVRLDRYAEVSSCCNDTYLKKYCYC